MENQNDVLELQEDSLEDVPFSETSEIAPYEYTELIEQTEAVNQQLTILTYTGILSMVGIALTVGVLCAVVFGRYFKA